MIRMIIEQRMRLLALGIVLAMILAGAYGVWRIVSEMGYYTVPAGAAKRPASAAHKGDLRARKAAWNRLANDIVRKVRAFDGTAGFVIKDLDMNWEIVGRADTPIPSASLVKIPVMFAYFDAAARGSIDLRSTIELQSAAKTPGSGLLKGTPAGQHFSIEYLIELMIAHSDNTAANILIDKMGIGTINAYCARIGLRHTTLVRRMMDFSGRKKGVENYTTARDMAGLLERLYRGKFISHAVSRRCLEVLAAQQVNDRIPKKLPAGTVVAHKTGLETGLCHDAGIVYTDKGNFLIVFLTKHGYKAARPSKELISGISLLVYQYYSKF